jgi:large subunit ribosomal protein L6
MSKIGKLPITLANGVSVTIQGNQAQITGPKGTASYTIPEGVTVTVAEGKAVVTIADNRDRNMRAVYGLTRANIANIVKGLDTGFERKLDIVGVGYRAVMQGTTLVLSLGFAHPVKFNAPTGVTLNVVDNAILVSGSDKIAVGQMAAQIRAVKPPEPYKGKGIKYAGERVRRKAGKAAKAAGAK